MHRDSYSRFWLGLGASLCLGLALLSVLLAKDHIHIAVAQRLIAASGDLESLLRVESQLRSVSRLSGSNGEASMLHARIWRERAVFLSGQARADALRRAVTWYRAASIAKPLWPAAWSGLFACLSALQQFDSEWRGALHRALQVGSNEAVVFRDLFPQLLLRWNDLDEGERRETLNLAARMATREPRWVVVLADRFGFLTPICDYLFSQSQDDRECQRFGWRPILGWIDRQLPTLS